MEIKKIITMALAFALILSGCSSGKKNSNDNINVPSKQDSNGNNLVLSLSGFEVTADSYFERLKNNTQAVDIMYSLIEKEAVKSKIPETPEMRKSADLYLNVWKENYRLQHGAEGEARLLDYFIENGVASFDDYLAAVIYEIQYKEFKEAYLAENYEELYDLFFEAKKPRKVRHVLIQMEDANNPTEEELARVAEVESLLALGKEFTEIAMEHSDDGSASIGGDLGLVTVDTQFVPEFLNAALELNEGEISGAVKSDYGYHFIQVYESNRDTMLSNEEFKETLSEDSIIYFLAMRKMDINFADETMKAAIDKYINDSINSILGGE